MVSIIVPVYNAEEYIDECVLSIVNQTHRDIEIILINDGSSDSSGKKCMRWAKKDNRIIYVSKKNEGSGLTRNLGVKLARGEYIVFIDSDDFCNDDFICKMYTEAVKKSADIVICDFFEYNSTAKKLTPKSSEYLPEQKDVLSKTFSALWAKIIKKDLILNNDIHFPAIPCGEDLAVHGFMLAKAANVAYLRERLYFYRINGNASITKNVNNLRYIPCALDFLADRFIRDGIFEQYAIPLRRIAVKNIAFALSAVKKADIELYSEIKTASYRFMDKRFPDWRQAHDLSIYSCGSYSLYSIAKKLCIDETNIFRCHLSSIKDIDFSSFDYVFIDFLDETDENLSPKEWEERCAGVIRLLKKNIRPEKAIMIKNKLATSYGEYGADKTFVDSEHIEKANRMLAGRYDYFEKNMPGILTVSLDNEAYLYTDASFRHGCYPHHFSDGYYSYMADIIAERMTEFAR